MNSDLIHKNRFSSESMCRKSHNSRQCNEWLTHSTALTTKFPQ